MEHLKYLVDFIDQNPIVMFSFIFYTGGFICIVFSLFGFSRIVCNFLKRISMWQIGIMAYIHYIMRKALYRKDGDIELQKLRIGGGSWKY